MTGFDLNVKLNFGQLTEAQSERIAEIIKETEYNVVASTPVFQIFDDKKGSQIIINTEQFAFKVARQYERDDLTSYSILCRKIMEALLDGGKSEACTVRFVNVFESKTRDTGVILKGMSTYNFEEDALKDVSTVGYRFLIKRDNIYDEIKVEPLIRDTKKMFIEGLFNREDVAAEDIEKYFEDAYLKYAEKVEFFTK
ncbi:MAG: hypothetical protein ACI4WY_04605 [Anaerovoracaceae bacterium]